MFFDRFKATARKNAEKEAALKATVSKTNTLDCHGRKSENALPSSVGHTSSSALDTTYPEHIAHDGSQNVTPCSYWNKQDHNQQYASSQQDPETMEGEIPFNLIRTPPHELECKIQNLESQIRVLQQEQKDMEDDHRGEKIRLQEKFSQLRLRHEEQKWQLTQRTDEVTRLTTEVSTLRNQHQSESIASEKTFKQELDMMARSHESMEESIRQDFELKREQFAHQAERDVTHLKAQHSKTLIALKKRHTEETAKLRKDVDAFSQALLQRDKFEAMSDKEMKARFSDLAQDVETLARGKWRPENSKWTPEVLQNLSTNQRVLGKHIIHDCIWMILNEHLFVSPFRILEAEGRVLEKQWLRDCGSSEGYCLPFFHLRHVDADTNRASSRDRWIYMATSRGCNRALEV
ncbi:hypothetical protein DL98DRAFT_533871 [Cadophora sp. DSE1049]|nr:hypothetical protein DL98DRAFT_533871 [Cadophora sp. DSE1049]